MSRPIVPEPDWPLPSDGLPRAILADLRTGRSGPLGERGLASAIDKQPRPDAVAVGPLGLAGDEQVEPFHGGADRAVLQYDADHYVAWRSELPDLAARLVPGAFGENLVASGMNEATLCIGDVVRTGTATLQVSEARSPCHKLNHRFGHPAMSRLTQASGRTGWFYRVLEPGRLRAGDEVQVVERPRPRWPLARVQYFLYTAPRDLARAAELADLPELSASHRSKFARRVERGAVEDWESPLG